ncbi:MAG: hypothetical protein VB961_15810 [Dehalococcoidia bacterium]
MFPGTANTSLSCSMAWFAVKKALPPSGASMTTVPSVMPLNDTVASSKVLGVGPRSQRMFGHHSAVGRNKFGQRSMLSGVDNVPPTLNGHRSPSRPKGCSMGNAINPASESAYYRNTVIASSELS